MKSCVAILLLATVLLAAKQASAEPSLETYTIQKCEEKLAPIFKKLENQGNNFNYLKFCSKLQNGIYEACKVPVQDICEKAPWKWLKFACNEYLAKWVCK